MDKFMRTGANQNICPEYIKMVGGISEDLLGKQDDGITFLLPITSYRLRKAIKKAYGKNLAREIGIGRKLVKFMKERYSK